MASFLLRMYTTLQVALHVLSMLTSTYQWKWQNRIVQISVICTIL